MRRALDAYPTDPKQVKILLNNCSIGENATIYEPCCGLQHRVARTLYSAGFKNLYLNDIDLKVKAHAHINAAHFIRDWTPRPDWVITNPPFSEAIGILRSSFTSAKVGVALLLRLSFLEPTYDRQNFLVENPPRKLIVLPRYSFTENGKTDSVTCAWMIWYPNDGFINRQRIIIVPKFK